MSAYTEHAKQLAEANRRYGKYEAAYNEQFACDPDPKNRKFNDTAPADDKQWARLENFRGNDRDARAAFQDNPNASAQPTAKEAKMWELNQSRNWDIDRQPDPYLDHANSKNKWLPPMAADREQDREKANAYATKIEEQHGAQYDAYAAKAGSKAVDRFDYLNTMAVVEAESRRDSQKQTQAQAPAQAPAETAQEAPARTRVSLASFQGEPTAYIEQRSQELAKLPDDELKQVMAQADADHRAAGRKSVAEEAPKVQQWNEYRAKEAAQQEHAQEVASQSQSQTQSQTNRRTPQQ